MHSDAYGALYGELSASEAASAMSSSRRSSMYQRNGAAAYSSSSRYSPFPSSLSATPYSEDSPPASPPTVSDILYQSRLILEHQDLFNRHNLCLVQLCDVSREAEALRQENAGLLSLNRELTEHLSLMIQADVQKRIVSDDFVNRFHGLCLGDKGADGRAWDEVSSDLDESPTSVMESDKAEAVGAQRVYLPKSISVRSNGYLKISQPVASQGCLARAQAHTGKPTMPRATSSLSTQEQQQQQQQQQQKVLVHGGKIEEDPLELEVYNQGMFKTELCNKWQQTGACPYGDHCQFAHGIEELRPVIRHPRYKTEVCRMVLAGDVCPYGHRCHFRHALTDQERAMGTKLLDDR